MSNKLAQRLLGCHSMGDTAENVESHRLSDKAAPSSENSDRVTQFYLVRTTAEGSL